MKQLLLSIFILVSINSNVFGQIPTITSFTPTSICPDSSATIFITGSNFIGVTAVTIGGNAASSFTVNNSTSITALLAPNSIGYITVTTPNGTVTSSSYFSNNGGFNSYAYITGYHCNDTLGILNTATNTIVGTVGIGNGATGVCVSPDGTKVYVTNANDNTVSVINTATNSVTSTIAVGNIPQGVSVSPDGTKVYVANYNNGNSGTVSIINSITNVVTGTVTVGFGPIGVKVSPDGAKVYVANHNNQSLSVIDAVTNAVTNIAGVGPATSVTFSLDGTKAYVTNSSLSGTVSIINTATNVIIGSVVVGRNPWGICISPDGTKLYVTNNGSSTINNVSVINTATNNVIATISLTPFSSASPWGISISPDGAKLYVIDQQGGNSCVISTLTNSVIASIGLSTCMESLGNFIANIPTVCISPTTFSNVGNIISPLGKPINNATVGYTGSSIGKTTSDNIGSYSINLNNGNYVLTPFKNNDSVKANGVTTLDVALVQEHILQKNILNSPYKIIAADINGDNRISVLDIVYMKRLILGIDTTFTNINTKQNRLWAFVDSSYKFPDSTNPFPFKDSLSYNGLTANMTNQTFIGCKLGDVNWDWNPAIPRQMVNNLNAIELSYDTIKTTEANQVIIPVKVKNFKDMLGMQFTISFNANVLQWQGLGNNPLGIETGTNHAAEGSVTFLWVDAKNEIKTLEDGSVIMELVFNRTGNCTNEQLDINSSITSIAAYDKDYNLHGIVLNPSLINSLENNFETWSIAPNPVTDGIIHVQMNLKDNKTIVFSLTDITGRVLLIKQIEAKKGSNILSLRKRDIPAGTYYLHAIGIDCKEPIYILINTH